MSVIENLPRPALDEEKMFFSCPILAPKRGRKSKAFAVLEHIARNSSKGSDVFDLTARHEDFVTTSDESNLSVATYHHSNATLFAYTDNSAVLAFRDAEAHPYKVMPIPLKIKDGNLFHKVLQKPFFLKVFSRGSRAVIHLAASRMKSKNSDVAWTSLEGYASNWEDIPYDAHRDMKLTLEMEIDAWVRHYDSLPRLSRSRKHFSFDNSAPEFITPGYVPVDWLTDTAKEKLENLLFCASMALFVNTGKTILVDSASIPALTTEDPGEPSQNHRIFHTNDLDEEESELLLRLEKAVRRILRMNTLGIPKEDLIQQGRKHPRLPNVKLTCESSAAKLNWDWYREEFSAHQRLAAKADFSNLCRRSGAQSPW